MIVTGMTEISKSRSKIYIDNEFAFVLYKGELRIYHIAVGKEISEADYDHIKDEVLSKRAKMRCMNLIKSRNYTRRQLEEKLKKGFYPEEVIEEALSYVESYGYINDIQYTRNYIEYSSQTKSKSRIHNDLIIKGIPKEIIDRIWEEIIGEDAPDIEEAQILKWLEKKKFNQNTATIQEKQKIFAYLYRKGFQIDSIRRVLLLDIT